MLDLTTIAFVSGLIPDPLKFHGLSFHLRGPIAKALADGKLSAEDLPFAVEALPDGLVPIEGRMFPLKDTLARIVSDGKFGLDDLLTAFAAWSGSAPAPRPNPVPAPGPVPPLVVSPPRPAPGGGLSVAQLKVRITRVTVSEPGRSDARTLAFTLASGPGGRQVIVLAASAGHDFLDDGSRINLDAGVEDMDGVGILIDEENNPELMGKLRWRARDIETGELLGQIGGAGMEDNQHIEGMVHFLDPKPEKGEGMWRRSGGMSVTAAVRAKCGFEVGFDGGKLCLGPVTPGVN